MPIWHCWPAVLVLQRVAGRSMGDIRVVLSLHMGMAQRSARPLDKARRVRAVGMRGFTDWISVDVEMPHASGYYLCWNPQHNRPIVAWYAGHVGRAGFETKREVSHWAVVTVPTAEPRQK